MLIIYGSKFAREYKKVPATIKIVAEKQEIVFRKNPFDPKLKTHKLKGRLTGFLSFSVGQKYRIIFELTNDRKTAYFYSVGDHDIYQ
ncbi:MAG: type II toxin-antitoxin system mRNA interferase toxin, RelE/StbE family [Candidatus Portnoybacteria bacterium]|nr:type II toxin-antitoxin system mRNA interferase toxin, RelE/StbE family [Candidatus Portnoybacteria bacterium]MDD4982700.1 type II toxin-antitoxin system mRNA interferase toxin, RelE/StbE family [Candidatus Portnoybacteria bacterium]